jgi:pimeloyl-ACP methyl ester carboxylesterase
MAAQRSPVAALILLAPSPPWGVLGGSLEEAVSAASLYALGLFWMQAIEPDYGVAGQYSLDGFDKAERRAVFARMGRESGRAMWETLNWWLDPFMTTRVDSGRIGAPVLVVAGERDLIHPPATVGQTAQRLGAPVKVMPGMSHWLVAEPGWQAVADHCLDWLGEVTESEPEPSTAKRG